ncbi:MAG: M16 family metallopeptidase, partial [Caulobacteraceae bacterium]
MKLFSPLAIALVLGLMLAGGAQAKIKAGAWPQAFSDVKPDPRILFGALPNGMRYAILKNNTPPGSVSIRFYIAAGSLMESDSQQGLAHLLEHMSFDGSTHVPNGEMVKILERHGLAFGADTNAQTSYDSTVFKLDLPKADASSLSDSLMLLREIAGNLTLDQGAIDKEKGVVLSEERTRDTPEYRAFVDRLGFILAGERAPEREPIGKVAVVAHAQRSQLEDLYRAYYRPDRATLIVVGDVDPQAVLGEIRARFSDWTGVGPAGKDPDLGRIEKRGPSFDFAVQPGAAMTIQVAWEEPPDLSSDSLAKRRRVLIDTLGLEVLDRRLSDLARSADPPFISAAALRRNVLKSAKVTSLLVLSDPDRWKQSLAAALAEERAAARFGVTAAELSSEITENRAELR